MTMSSMSPAARPVTSGRRRRRAHTKSRSGCVNCKVRKVKCNEGKPSCQQCKSYGVCCTYNKHTSELQQPGESVFHVSAPLESPLSNTKAVLATVNERFRANSGDYAFQIGDQELAQLNRFHERTSLTVGHGNTRHIYQREGTRLAMQHPFLMHIAITITMMHDRAHLPASYQTTSEIYHWCQAVSQYNQKLSGPLTSSELDAIWIAAVLLGCCTLAQVESDNPEECWPLKPPSPTDLDWIKISSGKKAAWAIADIFRPESSLHELQLNLVSDDFLTRPSDDKVFHNLPPALSDFCGLGPTSTPESNPCHIPGAYIARLVPLKQTSENLLKFLSFLGHIPLEFRTLLEVKDPRALLLMLWYHSMWCPSEQWWMRRRCEVESKALIIYLERYHGNVTHLQKMLEFPKRARFAMLLRSPKVAVPEMRGIGSGHMEG